MFRIPHARGLRIDSSKGWENRGMFYIYIYIMSQWETAGRVLCVCVSVSLSVCVCVLCISLRSRLLAYILTTHSLPLSVYARGAMHASLHPSFHPCVMIIHVNVAKMPPRCARCYPKLIQSNPKMIIPSHRVPSEKRHDNIPSLQCALPTTPSPRNWENT
jgi:hypothetical protein